MAFDVKSEILAAIGKTDDPNLKMILLLMLGVLESTGEAIEGIGRKIDGLRDDEDSLRKAVLNGHEPVHHKHHEWTAEQIEAEDERRLLREWVASKMAEEAQAALDAKELAMVGKKAAVTTTVQFIATAVLSALAGMIGALVVLR